MDGKREIAGIGRLPHTRISRILGEVSYTALAVQSLCDGEDETVRRDGGAVSPPRRCRPPVADVSSHSWTCGAGSGGKYVVVFVFAVAVYHRRSLSLPGSLLGVPLHLQVWKQHLPNNASTFSLTRFLEAIDS